MGSANYLDEEGQGAQTTAIYDADTDSWMLNGDKIWGTSCSGWDDLGADLQTLLVRNLAASGSKAESSCSFSGPAPSLTKTAPGTIKTATRLSVIQSHPASSPPLARTSTSPSSASPPASSSPPAPKPSTSSPPPSPPPASSSAPCPWASCAPPSNPLSTSPAPTQPAAASLSSTNNPPADLLIDIKCRIKACRALTWKAAAAIDAQLPGADELAYEVKIYASEAAVRTVAEAMRVVGVRAYDAQEWQFASLMADALVLPIFDGGNQGVRRRQVQAVLLEPGYEPWAATFGMEREV